MNKGIIKGMIIGGVVATSVSLFLNSDMMTPAGRKRMMKSGRNMMKRTGSFFSGMGNIIR